jgi:hypothetical protein
MVGIAGGRAETTHTGAVLEIDKKEEFPGFMETCCLGTPFPRSALFLFPYCGNPGNCTRVLKEYGLK